jgi:hypothetical protein
MDRDLLPLDALPLSDFDEAEAAGYELDVAIGGLGPVPGGGAQVAVDFDEESFDASILAALLRAR